MFSLITLVHHRHFGVRCAIRQFPARQTGSIFYSRWKHAKREDNYATVEIIAFTARVSATIFPPTYLAEWTCVDAKWSSVFFFTKNKIQNDPFFFFFFLIEKNQHENSLCSQLISISLNPIMAIILIFLVNFTLRRSELSRSVWRPVGNSLLFYWCEFFSTEQICIEWARWFCVGREFSCVLKKKN